MTTRPELRKWRVRNYWVGTTVGTELGPKILFLDRSTLQRSDFQVFRTRLLIKIGSGKNFCIPRRFELDEPQPLVRDR